MLVDADEALHRPPVSADANWQENMFFICWDGDSRTGLLCHVQRVPGREVQEARICAIVDGQVASVTVEGPYDDALAAGLKAEPVDPFRRWRIAITAIGALGPGPLGLYATATGGHVPMAVDLTLESRLPVANFAEALASMVVGMQARPDGPQMGDQQHYEQGGTWRGTVRVGDRLAEASGLFVRDHSWGTRHEHHDFRAFWTASCLDGGSVFCNAIGIPSGDLVIGAGAVVDKDGVRWTSSVSADFSPAAGICSYDRVTVSYGTPLSRTLSGRTQLHVPILLPYSGMDRYDNNALSEVAMGDLRGFGVLEWASVLTPEEAAVLS